MINAVRNSLIIIVGITTEIGNRYAACSVFRKSDLEISQNTLCYFGDKKREPENIKALNKKRFSKK